MSKRNTTPYEDECNLNMQLNEESQFENLFEEKISDEQLREYHMRFSGMTAQDDLEKWRSISRTIYQITHATERQTHVVMRSALQFYTLLNQNGRLHEDGQNKWKQDYLNDDKLCDYFLNTFIFESAKYLIDEKVFELEETLYLSNCILLQIVYLVINTFEKTTPAMAYTLAYIFDHRKTYFVHNNKIIQPFHV